MTRKRIIILSLILLIIGIGYWILSQQQSSQTSASNPSQETYVVARKTLRETITISGEMDAQERVTMTFPTGGRLAWVGVKEGDYVAKYQGIASLDQRDVEKRLQSSLNTYMISRWDFEQTKTDNKDAQYRDGDLGDKMKRIVDRAQFGLDNAVIAVELQALAKEYAYLMTPIEGIVTRVDAPYAGVTVGVTSAFEVVNPATVYFSATADQTEVTKLRTGQKATIIVDAYPDERIGGVISSIAFSPRTGDTGTSYEVKLALKEAPDVMKYRLGMTGDVEFVTKEQTGVFAVPTTFVLSEAGKKYVFVMKDNKKIKTEVKTGAEGDTDIEIVSGVRAGDVLAENVK